MRILVAARRARAWAGGGGDLPAAVGLVAGAQALSFASALCFWLALGRAHTQRAPRAVVVAGLALTMLSPLVRGAGQRVLERAAHAAELGCRRALLSAVFAGPLTHQRARSTGEWMTTLEIDAQSVRDWHTVTLANTVSAVALIAGSALVAAAAAPRLLPLVLVPVAVLAGGALALRRRDAARARRLAEEHARYHSLLQEYLHGFEALTAADARAWATERLAERDRARAEARRHLGGRALRDAVVDASTTLAMWAVLLFGARFVARGALTLGALLVFQFLFMRLLSPVRGVPLLVRGWGDFADATERLASLTAAAARARDEGTAGGAAGALPAGEALSVRLSAVRFGYEDAAQRARVSVLEGLSLAVSAGERVAVLGPSGAGKSTLGRLVARLALADAGEVSLGGVDLRGVSPEGAARAVGYVEQDVALFEGSVRENVRLGLGSGHGPGDDDEGRVDRAMRAACVDELLRARGEGDGLAVGASGRRLSGGQRKRVALARALVREPGLLVIDQLASEVDARLCRDIFSRVRAGYPRTTVLYLGHRVPAGLEPDAVYWLEGGALLRRDDLRAEAAHDGEAPAP